MLKLRIFRRWSWELDCPSSEVRFSGSNPMALVAHDELQYLDENCSPSQWFPVEIVEDEKPSRPKTSQEIRDDERYTRIGEGLRDVFKNAKQGHFAVGIQRHGEHSKCICGGRITYKKCENDTSDRAI